MLILLCSHKHFILICKNRANMNLWTEVQEENDNRNKQIYKEKVTTGNRLWHELLNLPSIIK